MDKILETLIFGFPNFAGLFLVLWWQRQTNERLIGAIERLVLLVVDCYENEEPKPRE